MKKQMLTRIINITCAVLLVALFASFFLPSWDFTDKVKVDGSREKVEVPSNSSVMEFTWMAFNNKELSKQFNKQGYEVNDIVVMPFVLTLCVVAGVIACLLNMNGSWHSVFPVIGGGFTAINLLTNSALQMGPYWTVNLILAIALFAVSAVLFGILVKKIVDWFVIKHRRL